MYCPKCKEEYPGKFCPECGTKLIDKPLQDDIGLNISDNAAIVGGVNVNRSEVHNKTSYDQRVINSSSITNNIVERTKSEAELRNERTRQFMECCKQAFSDGLLTEEEKRELATERIRLGIDEKEAERIIEMTRRSSGSRISTLGVRDAMILKSFERSINDCNTTVLNSQLPRLAALARNYKVDDVLYKYYMLLAALHPEELIREYEASASDEYWQTYWAALAYTKYNDIEKAEEAIVKLSYFPDYPEDNALLLSAVSIYSELGAESAIDYICAIFPDQCSPLLTPFVKALFLEIMPERAEEVNISIDKCQFYIDNLITIETPEEKEAKRRAEEEAKEAKRRSEEEARIKAEEAKRKSEEEALYRESEDSYEKGNNYYDDENYTEAVKWYRKAAELGHAEAQFSLGCCYEFGEGVEEDKKSAVKWYRKAAEFGHAEAQFYLANCYSNGEGVSEDYAEAVKWYRKAAEQGYADAQYNLGYCYYNGEGVSEDYAEAVKWYRKAAEQGNANAQCNLGICYYNGKGVREDNDKAVMWFRKAVEGENEVAQYFLGECYENGYGVEENIDEAIKWYRKAAEQGDEDAAAKLEELDNNEDEDIYDEEENNPHQKYIDMIKDGCVLQAVKEYMDDNKIGLKDAKDFIDNLKATLRK